MQTMMQIIQRPPKRSLLLAAAVATIATSATLIYTFSRTGTTAQPTPPVVTPVQSSVVALGRLEPQGEVIQLAPSAQSSQSSRVAQLLVKQGDRVRQGQVIAVLDSRDRLQAALEKAQDQVRIAQTRLARVQAGAKTGEIDAQAATITRLEAELNNAQIEAKRYETLYQEGAIAASQRDSKRLVEDTTRAQLQQAKNTLNSVAEVRPVDVQAAAAEVASAQTAVKQAQADLDLAYIRAPRSGQVLKIHTYAGEIVGSEGIVELGQTNQMYVVAEVYESDVKYVRLGQPASITSSAFDGTAQGKVSEIGLKIQRKGVLDTNPTADADARIVEVRIRLNPEASPKVASLTNLEVTVAIQRDER